MQQGIKQEESHIGAVDTQLALPLARSLMSLNLPENLTVEDWLRVGQALGRTESAVMWWIGDWWAYGEHCYGDREALIEGEEWEGPAFQTCRDAAWVCRRIKTSRRRDVLGFSAHKEIAVLPEEWLDKVLAWAVAGENGGPRTVATIRQHVKECRTFIARDRTQDQLDHAETEEVRAISTSSGTPASASTRTLASTSTGAATECVAPMATALASERHNWLAAIDGELLDLSDHCRQNHDIAELGVGNLLDDAHRRIAGRLAMLQEAKRAHSVSGLAVERENIVNLIGATRAEEAERQVVEGQDDLRLARQRQALELLDQGMAKTQIARRFSTSPRSLSRLLAAARPSNSTERSTLSARAGIRDATKKQIAKLAKQGLSQRAIAGQLGVSRDMVYRSLKKVKGAKGRPRNRRFQRKATSINQRPSKEAERTSV